MTLKGYNHAGFTLVELAIVITIIGLLIGGVLKGQELLENARMTSLGRNVQSYQAAVTTFRDLYKSLPGDTANATNFITGCTAGNSCVNGDGNGTIGVVDQIWTESYNNSPEPFQAWKHMALANLVTNIDVTKVPAADSFRGGVDVPASPLGGQVYIKTAAGDGTTVDRSLNGVVLYVSGTTTGYFIAGSALFTPSLAQKIDLKLDDGKAFTGDTLAMSNSMTSGCGTTANGTNGYNVNVSTKSCDMGFSIGK